MAFAATPKVGRRRRPNALPAATARAHARRATYRPTCVDMSLVNTARGVSTRRSARGACAASAGGSRGVDLGPGRIRKRGHKRGRESAIAGFTSSAPTSPVVGGAFVERVHYPARRRFPSEGHFSRCRHQAQTLGGSRAAARKNHKPIFFAPFPAPVFKSETTTAPHFSRAVERCKFQAARRSLWGG